MAIVFISVLRIFGYLQPYRLRYIICIMEMQILEYELMAEAIKVRIGARIRVLRNNKGLTQEQLATLSGTKQPNIQMYEAGLRSPTIEVLEKIAKALRVDLKELF